MDERALNTDLCQAPSPRPNARGIKQREQIVSAAIKSIAAGGFEKFRVRDVAALAGINNATLHYYFPTKAHLIEAVVEAFVEYFHQVGSEDVDPEILSMPAPQRRRLRLFSHLEVVRRHAIDAPGVFQVMSELLLRGSRDPKMVKLIEPSQREWELILAQIIADDSDPDEKSMALARVMRIGFIGLLLDMSGRGIWLAMSKPGRARAEYDAMTHTLIDTILGACDGAIYNSKRKN